MSQKIKLEMIENKRKMYIDLHICINDQSEVAFKLLASKYNH